MQSRIREVVDLLLAQNSEYSASPVFCSTSTLKGPTPDYVFIGSVLFSAGLICKNLTPEVISLDGFSLPPVLAFIELSCSSSDCTQFAFAGYRVYAPGLVPWVVEAVPTIQSIEVTAEDGNAYGFYYSVTLTNGVSLYYRRPGAVPLALSEFVGLRPADLAQYGYILIQE